MKRHTFVALAVVVALSFVPLARADQAVDKQTEAKKYFEAGQTYYDLGEFQKAIENFKKAYEISGFAQLLFNIAQSYRLMGDAKQALVTYKSYLRKMPDAPNRAYVEERIKEMEAAVAAKPTEPAPGEPSEAKPVPSPAEAAKAAEPERAPSPAVPEGADTGSSDPIYKKWWFWAGAGAVVVGTIVVVAVATSGGGAAAPDTDFPVVDAF